MKHYLHLAWEVIKEVIRLGLLALIPIVIDSWLVNLSPEMIAIFTAVLRGIEKQLWEADSRFKLPI